MLHSVFIDDSGSKDYTNPYKHSEVNNPPVYEDNEQYWRDNYFVLCAVRVKQSDLAFFDDQINELKINCFNTKEVEIKSTWLRVGKKRKKYYLDKYNTSNEKINAFGEALIDLVSSNTDKLKLIAVVFDKRYYGDKKRGTKDGSPLLKTAQILLERIHYQSGNDIVIFDQMEDSLGSHVGRNGQITGIYQKNLGMEQSFVGNYRSISDVVFKDSANENLLQIADLCAYNIYRQFIEYGREWGGIKEDEKGVKHMEEYSYFERIRCNFVCDSFTRKVRGFGLSCCPDFDKVEWDIHHGCKI